MLAGGLSKRSGRGRRGGGGGALARFALLMTGLLLSPALARAQTPLELAVKATYLYKFAPFVQWPATSSPDPSGSFAICVIGADPFGGLLDRAVEGQSVEARPIVIRRMAVADAKASCQIAYLGGSAEQNIRDALDALHGAPVLTVTDQAATPGVVDFSIVDGRVRFAVDDQAAAANGLTISSKLLRLALSVKLRTSPGTNQ